MISGGVVVVAAAAVYRQTPGACRLTITDAAHTHASHAHHTHAHVVAFQQPLLPCQSVLSRPSPHLHYIYTCTQSCCHTEGVFVVAVRSLLA